MLHITQGISIDCGAMSAFRPQTSHWHECVWPAYRFRGVDRMIANSLPDGSPRNIESIQRAKRFNLIFQMPRQKRGEIFDDLDEPGSVVVRDTIHDLLDVGGQEMQTWVECFVLHDVPLHEALLAVCFEEWEHQRLFGLVMFGDGEARCVAEGHEVGDVFGVLDVARLQRDGVEGADDCVVDVGHLRGELIGIAFWLALQRTALSIAEDHTR